MRCPRIYYKIFEKIIGKLSHADIGLPDGKGPLYTVQQSYGRKIKTSVIRKIRYIIWSVRGILDTHIRKKYNRGQQVYTRLPKENVDYLGYMDASESGAGGIWTRKTGAYPNIVRRIKWPEEITEDIVSDDNPKGKKLPTQIWKWRRSCYSG